MKGLQRIIFRNFAGIGLLDLPIGRSSVFAGLSGEAAQAIQAALALYYLPESLAQAANYFAAEDSFLVFEAEGSAGPFLALCCLRKETLVYRLLPGPWDGSLFRDEAGRLLVPEQAERIWKKLKLKVSPPLSAEAMQKEIWQGESTSAFYQGISLAPALRTALFTCALRLQASDLWSLLLPDRPPQAAISLDALRADLSEYRSQQEDRLMLASLTEEIEAAGALLTRLRALQAEEQAGLQLLRERYQQIRAFFCAAPAPAEQPGAYISPLGLLLRQRFANMRVLESEMAETYGKLPELYLARDYARREAAALRDRLQSEKELLKQTADEQVALLQASLAALTQDDKRLRATGLRFRDWLEDRYPDWRQSIGKVCRPELLDHPWLSPQIERINDLLFGIRLDLSELPEPPVAIPERASEPSDRESKRQQLQKQLVHEKESLSQQLIQCERKYKARIQESTREIARIQYEIDQAEVQLKRLKLEKEEQLHQTLLLAEKQALGSEEQAPGAAHPMWQQFCAYFPALAPSEAPPADDPAFDPEKCVKTALQLHDQTAQMAKQVMAAAASIASCMAPSNSWRIKTRCHTLSDATSVIETASEALRASAEPGMAASGRSLPSILGGLAKAYTEIGEELGLFYQQFRALQSNWGQVDSPFAAAPNAWGSLLSEINRFWQEHQDHIGEPSLLNPHPDPDANRQAWHLLGKLEAACLQSPHETLDARLCVQVSGPAADDQHAEAALALLSMARKHLPALPNIHMWLPAGTFSSEKKPEGLILLQAEAPQTFGPSTSVLFLTDHTASALWSVS